MNNGLQLFTNELFQLAVKLDNGEWVFDAEQVAKDLGIIEVKNEKEYVMWRRINQYLKPFGISAEDSPQVGKGDFIPEAAVYKLAFKANNQMAEKFQDWLAIEVIPTLRKTGEYKLDKPIAFNEKLENLKLEQEGFKLLIDVLRPSQASTIKMLADFNKSQGLSTAYLPTYTDEKVGKSATELLKQLDANISVIKFNKAMLEQGFLEELERPSTRGTKKYKSLTEKGLQYGKNAVNTKGSEKETQPLYYEDTFQELLNFIMSVKGVG